jgi:kinesin family protein 11
MNEREIKLNSVNVIECREKGKEILVVDKNAPVPTTKTFTFDKVFGVYSKQSEVYNQVVRPAVLEVIEGYNCTIFAYGQTGTGNNLISNSYVFFCTLFIESLLLNRQNIHNGRK